MLFLSTDIIVGFPGETDEDFEATLSLYEEVAYDQAYMFLYSARPGTPSYKHFDDMPREVKTARMQRLIEKQKHWSHQKNQRFVGQNLRVLIKEEASSQGDYVAGHSDQNHTVLVPKSQAATMGLYDVRIDTATPHTLYGTVKGFETDAIPLMMA